MTTYPKNSRAKKSPDRLFTRLLRLNACDRDCVYWHGILRYDESANNFQTVRSIHHSCLQASFGIAASYTTSLDLWHPASHCHL